MSNWMDPVLKDKRVTVVGLARSGVGAANLLSSLGASVTVTDMKTEDQVRAALLRLAPGVKRALGGHPEEVFRSADMIVVSPGVPLEIGPLALAKGKGVPVIGELELAFRVLQAKAGKPVPFIAVTGSNGKSTTTTLVDLMLRRAGYRTMLGGNIGNALTDEIHKLFGAQEVKAVGKDKDSALLDSQTLPAYAVVEVSSFQLEAIETFRPHIAAVLNITPDHLDRYHSMPEYAGAKARVFENQGETDFLVLNADDPETMNMGRKKREAGNGAPEICYFSRIEEVEGLFLKDGVVFCNIPQLPFPGGPFPLISAEQIRIRGVHNLENAMAASAMALLAGCPPDVVRAALAEFGGLEHRLEFVREFDGVRYINDSKGTNVGAVIKSLESFGEPLILIAGGRDKAGDFSLLRELVSRKVRTLVLIGEAAGKIRAALGDVTDAVSAKDLKEAVAISRERAGKGDVVLLSPACASFDMFRDFEDRGRQFKEAVMELGL